jgi:integrase
LPNRSSCSSSSQQSYAIDVRQAHEKRLVRQAVATADEFVGMILRQSGEEPVVFEYLKNSNNARHVHGQEAFERFVTGRKPGKLPPVLVREEIARFLAPAKGYRNRVALAPAYAAGLRIGEARARA